MLGRFMWINSSMKGMVWHCITYMTVSIACHHDDFISQWIPCEGMHVWCYACCETYRHGSLGLEQITTLISFDCSHMELQRGCSWEFPGLLGFDSWAKDFRGKNSICLKRQSIGKQCAGDFLQNFHLNNPKEIFCHKLLVLVEIFCQFLGKKKKNWESYSTFWHIFLLKPCKLYL